MRKSVVVVMFTLPTTDSVTITLYIILSSHNFVLIRHVRGLY